MCLILEKKIIIFIKNLLQNLAILFNLCALESCFAQKTQCLVQGFLKMGSSIAIKKSIPSLASEIYSVNINNAL